MKRKLRAGIIGCGRIAGLLQDDPLRKGVVTHIAAYAAFPKTIAVVACVSRHKEQARSFAQRFNIKTWYDDHRSMLAKEKLDVVSVCAYTDSRYAMIKDAVDHGVRGIFCEKPVAASLKEVDRIIALCKKNNVRIIVNHTRRWGHDYRTVKRLIESKEFGGVRSVTGYFSGAIFHTGTHMFDIMNYFCGRPSAVIGSLAHERGTRFDQLANGKMVFDDFDGHAFIFYPGNVVANVVGIPKHYFIFELDIHLEKARIRIGNGLFELYATGPSVRYSGFNELRPSIVTVDTYPLPPLAWAVDDLVRSLRTRKKNISTAVDARMALEIAFGIVHSHRQGHKKISLPLTQRSLRVRAR